MKHYFFIILTLLFSLFTEAQQTSFKFDFGSGKVEKGYTQVMPETKYTSQTGYGFDFDSKIKSVENDSSALKGDYITGKGPFYFSVKLPEGNYDVKVVLGDTKGTSATSVRAECRRLMLPQVTTKQGETVERTFTVHVRDSLIRDGKGNVIDKVHVKPREKNYLHWDNVLTLEFNDSLPKICAIEITPNKSAATIFLAGDSTVVDQPEDPYASWGQMFPAFLIPSKVAVANYAESGETLKAFENENRFEKIWSMAKPGDYLFIEFTHNDQKPGPNHLDAFTTFKETLKNWIAEARKRDMIPVLVTSTQRRNFDEQGHIVNTLLDYPEGMRQAAKEENVALIDLSAMSKTLYETLGKEQSVKAFVHYPANTYPNQTKTLEDNTHFNPYGAYELASCVVSSIREQKLPLAKYIRKNVKEYNPARPNPVATFYWPQSGFVSAVKPDGN
ncbi:rhamnogalacturonan acetylesterase [Flavobacterium zepuense]|uniref:Rhamnogalacturonan acetylesterase n=1 Tax=Flavobacterium zepuense TaxID=2593302 RepID=A0A552V065_9FLAO|nr:rhamnogalacturonan acetylesterase [Flavobacterium zepuense]TRW23866.1 rhamnogalacturonan acetylesterase [Flavobacterium zepuense]